MKSKLYQYVGPPEIQKRCQASPKGTIINSASDFLEWIERWKLEVSKDGIVVVTFVIDQMGQLRVAPRNSEHVACAGGEAVLSAGEMFVRLESAEIEEISNQSTGYCPEPESWNVVQDVLDRIGLRHPGEFSTKIIFRLCPKCGQRNIVKDDWFACAVCKAELPLE